MKLFAQPAAVGRVFNLGSDEEVSIEGLAERVIAAAGSTSVIEHIPYEQAYGRSFDDLQRRVPKLDKIRRAIGFRPRLGLDEIVRSVVDHARADAAAATGPALPDAKPAAR